MDLGVLVHGALVDLWEDQWVVLWVVQWEDNGVQEVLWEDQWVVQWVLEDLVHGVQDHQLVPQPWSVSHKEFLVNHAHILTTASVNMATSAFIYTWSQILLQLPLVISLHLRSKEKNRMMTMMMMMKKVVVKALEDNPMLDQVDPEDLWVVVQVQVDQRNPCLKSEKRLNPKHLRKLWQLLKLLPLLKET